MKNTTHYIITGFIYLLLSSLPFFAKSQTVSEEVKIRLNDLLYTFAKSYIEPRTIQVDSIVAQKHNLIIYTNEALEDIPFREENVAQLYNQIRQLFPACKDISLLSRGIPIDLLIPEYDKKRRINKDKLYAVNHKGAPLTTLLSQPLKITKGLQNRHIALWQSHGMYYNQSTPRWEWQRARLFGTVEDLYTQSFVLPYLIPMLENAGANVLVPKERDIQHNEIIIDNDGPDGKSEYIEYSGKNSWMTGNSIGFADRKPVYVDGENPFRMGTFRQCITQRKEDNASIIEWHPNIPEKGEYAVYVSYHSLPQSTDQALYTVKHLGGESTISVNQMMGGGTWIYIGHYPFVEGKSGKVSLTNRSNKNGKIVTADAIKIGGGIGNIARSPLNQTYTIEPETSSYPRFAEAARYWLQWAGMPDSIYSHTSYEDDYRDDIYARAKWVNYLKDELNIPIDMAFAFHSDAGITPNDSTIGTLGIYMSMNNDGKYTNNKSKETARDLTDLIVSQIISDIRQTYNPQWTRRGMWNQSYIEARLPDVPTMLLELLSHQNFADMRFGLDPRFRFLTSRAIYKGILRYICFQNRQPYIVQPLPPDNLRAEFAFANEVRIGWEAVQDPLESTAVPTSYILYTRIGDGDFDNGQLINENHTRQIITPGTLYSYKIAAVNEGGKSFPSEILTVYRDPAEKGTVLIVNGFDRISAPAAWEAPRDSLAGFSYETDFGVPYIRDISFVGNQYEYRRSASWITNDQNGHGDSYNNYAGQVIAGNTFDYPAVHGKAIAAAGYSFVSCSQKAVINGLIDLTDYPVVDLILGKQKRTTMGTDTTTVLYEAFPPKLQDAIKEYCRKDGRLFVSGAYIGTDLLTSSAHSLFLSEVLSCRHASSNASREGKVRTTSSPYPFNKQEFTFHNTLNSKCYSVEQVDGLLPANDKAYCVLRYPENNIGAAIASEYPYKTFVMGLPFETITSTEEQIRLMDSILEFFSR